MSAVARYPDPRDSCCKVPVLTVCVRQFVVGDARQRRRTAIVGKPGRHRRARSPDLQVGSVGVLVADEAEELVLDKRAAKVPPAV